MFNISASLIRNFKSCPYITYLGKIEGIRKTESTEAQRYGTNWHKVLEVMSLEAGSVCPECCDRKADPNCPLCHGTDSVEADEMTRVSNYLDYMYDNLHPNLDVDQASLEKTRLINAAAAYSWHYSDREEEVLARELRFELPINFNRVKKQNDVPNRVVGIIDKIVSRGGIPGIKEHKSTSSAIDMGSSYWDSLPMDTQALLYVYAAQRLQASGDLAAYGITDDNAPIDTVYYDVYHKPTSKPKDLTQKASKEFVESGTYYGVAFDIDVCEQYCNIDGLEAVVTPGRKEGSFAIKETHAMYGARLLADMMERPEFYFAEKTLTFRPKQIAKLEKEIEDVVLNLIHMQRFDCFIQNEKHCTATYTCEYYEICKSDVDISGQLPLGYERKTNASKTTAEKTNPPKSSKKDGRSGKG